MIITAMPNYPSGKIFAVYRGKWKLRETVNGLDVRRYILYPSNSPKKLPRIFSMLSFSITSFASLFTLRSFRPDYIFTESPPLTLGLTGLMLSRLTGAKHIMNVSDIWPLSAHRLGAISKGGFYNSIVKLERYLYRKSFGCTGQSEEIVQHILQEGGKHVQLFRNGVDITRFQYRDSQGGSGKLKIVYTGLLGVAQGIAGICRHISFAKLNAEFHIYGEGSERPAIEEYLQAHPDCGIIYHGLARRDEIPGILADADVTLIPLIKPIEGAVPSKIYESMAAGTPIIFSGGGEGAKIVAQYDTGWVCNPRKYAEISACIENIANGNRAELKYKGANGRSAAGRVFSRQIQVDQLHSFLLNGNEANNSSRRKA